MVTLRTFGRRRYIWIVFLGSQFNYINLYVCIFFITALGSSKPKNHFDDANLISNAHLIGTEDMFTRLFLIEILNISHE